MPQVKVLSFHPTQPWLAYADRGQDLTVLDWQTQQVQALFVKSRGILLHPKVF